MRVLPVLTKGTLLLILVTGGEIVELVELGITLVILDAEIANGTNRLTGGDFILLGSGIAEFARINKIALGDLPGALPAGTEFISAIMVELFKDGQLIKSLSSGQSYRISLVIPNEYIGREFVLLWWSTNLNAWVEIPVLVVGFDSDQVTLQPLTVIVRYWNDNQNQWVQVDLSVLTSDLGFSVGFGGWQEIPAGLADSLPNFAKVDARAISNVNQSGIFVLVAK